MADIAAEAAVEDLAEAEASAVVAALAAEAASEEAAEASAEAVALEVDSAADIAAADSADLITIPRIITILTVISGVPAGAGVGVRDAIMVPVAVSEAWRPR